MLEIKHLSYQVADETGEELGILRDISLSIADHKFVVITGPNGGGKTTLAKAIMGLVQPTGGQILWNGEDVTRLSVTERARRGISYGFQQPPRFKGLRVRDLLELASGQEKLTHDQECQYLTRVGLCAADYIDREVDALPLRRGGQAHRDRHHPGPERRPDDLRRAGGGHRPVVLRPAHRDLPAAPRRAGGHPGGDLPPGAHHRPGRRDRAGLRSARLCPKAEVFPQILANTVSGCSYMKEA